MKIGEFKDTPCDRVVRFLRLLYSVGDGLKTCCKNFLYIYIIFAEHYKFPKQK